ncbi:hypothetical protein [Stetteria hydrogenophila]
MERREPRQGDSIDVSRLAFEVEEEVRRILERLLGRRASAFFVTVKLVYTRERLLEVVVDVEATRGAPGVDLDAVVEEALEAARDVVRRYLRRRRREGGGGAKVGGEVLDRNA